MKARMIWNIKTHASKDGRKPTRDWKGSDDFEIGEVIVGDIDSLAIAAKEVLSLLIQNKDRKSKASMLSCVYGGESYIKDLEVLSCFFIYEGGDSISSTREEKYREKIKKLLSLSMSDNKNEASVASSKAIELMNKYAIGINELEKDDMIILELPSLGKRVSPWEIMLYTCIGDASGCYFTYTQAYITPDESGMSPGVLSFCGLKRDVLNASYIGSCYSREIINMTKATKTERNLSTKESNDFRVGLVEGVIERIMMDTQSFFSKKKLGSEVVVVNCKMRSKRAEDYFEQVYTEKSAERDVVVRASKLKEEGKVASLKIVPSKATNNNKRYALMAKE